MNETLNLIATQCVEHTGIQCFSNKNAEEFAKLGFMLPVLQTRHDANEKRLGSGDTNLRTSEILNLEGVVNRKQKFTP